MAKAYPRAAFALTIFVLMNVATMIGCGSKSPDDVVATFNGEELTLGYLEAKWGKLAVNDTRFAGDPDNSALMDSLRQEVLEIIINKELIVDQARKRKFVDDETYIEAYEGQKNYRLIELLKNREIFENMPEFTEEDYRAQYDLVGYKVKARHVNLDRLEGATELAQRIRDGEISFEDAVQQHSTNPDRETGGDIGTVSFGSNIKPVEETLFAMEPGEISEPVKTPYGYSIFICDDKTYEDPPEYGSVKASIINRLEMRAMREIGAEHAKKVMDKYGFKFDWDVAEHILPLMPDDPTPSQARDSRLVTQEKPILKFTDEELKMVLYEVEGKQYTLQEFSDEYDRLYVLARPMKSSRLRGIYNWVHKDVIGKLMPKDAVAIGLDKDPELVNMLKEFEEQSCIGAVRRAVVDNTLIITDEDVRRWYDENPEYYTLRPQVICKQLITAEEDSVIKAHGLLLAGADVDSVGERFSLTFPKQWQTDYFSPDSLAFPDNVAMREVQRLQNPGDFTPPFHYQGYWGIMILIEQRPSRLMDFSEAEERISRDLKELRSSEKLDSLLNEWRNEAEIVVFDKVLNKAEPGPPPTPKEGRI